MLVDGREAGRVSALDRGLGYGDGLFESLLLVNGAAPLWPRHMHRLATSCERLRMPAPDTERLWREASEVASGMTRAVVRITFTRGIGARGYTPPATVVPTRIVAAFAAPAPHVQPLRMRVCDLRLGEQPALAGMKHLNRLEQVLARAEWNDPAIAEGVLCDGHDRVISATMANLFAAVGGEWVTPALDRCGVAGVARAEVLAVCPWIRVGELGLDALRGASEVFLSSSVRGILPVHSLDGHDYVPGDTTRRLQEHWRDLGFSMEQAG